MITSALQRWLGYPLTTVKTQVKMVVFSCYICCLFFCSGSIAAFIYHERALNLEFVCLLCDGPNPPRVMRIFEYKLSKTFGNELSKTFGEELSETFGEELSKTFGEELSKTFGEELSETFGEELSKTFGEELSETIGEELSKTCSLAISPLVITASLCGVMLPWNIGFLVQIESPEAATQDPN